MEFSLILRSSDMIYSWEYLSILCVSGKKIAIPFVTTWFLYSHQNACPHNVVMITRLGCLWMLRGSCTKLMTVWWVLNDAIGAVMNRFTV